MRRRALGYSVTGIERLMQEMALRYEKMWRDNASLRARLKRADEELARYRAESRETREVLLTAQQAAEALRIQAGADAERRLKGADDQARRILEEAGDKLAESEENLRRIEEVGREIQSGYRAFLLAALELLEGGQGQLGGGPEDAVGLPTGESAEGETPTAERQAVGAQQASGR